MEYCCGQPWGALNLRFSSIALPALEFQLCITMPSLTMFILLSISSHNFGIIIGKSYHFHAPPHKCLL